MVRRRMILAASAGWVLIAAIVAHAGPGSIVAKVDGRKITGKWATHCPLDPSGIFFDGCLVFPSKKVGCFKEIAMEVDLAAGATGTFPCNSMRYIVRDATGNQSDWDASICNVTIVKDRVKRPTHNSLPIIWRLRGRFDATVAPASGQGGADLPIRGHFVSANSCGGD
jgi:hypothetical protein